LDLVAIAAGAISTATVIVYLLIMRAQEGTPVWWFLGGLVIAVTLLGYGARREAPRRRLAVTLAGADLLGLGILGLLSIGFPLLCAGALALISARRE
jgi:hypothetical protein